MVCCAVNQIARDKDPAVDAYVKAQLDFLTLMLRARQQS